MRLRLMVILVMAIVGAITVTLLGFTGRLQLLGVSDDSLAGSGWRHASPDAQVWDREGQFLFLSNQERFHDQFDPLLYPGDIPLSPSSVRVLVLGDSFVYGAGVSDPDTRWWVKLQDELDAATAPGVFSVRAMGSGGASTATMSTWLEKGVLGKFDPDIVIVGYVYNDPLPSVEDFSPGGPCFQTCPQVLSYLPEFRQCLMNSSFNECSSRVGPRFPDAVPDFRVLENPLSNPYSSVFTQAVASIRESVGPRPLLWAPTPSTLAEWDASEQVRPIFKDSGFTEVTPRRSLALLDRVRPELTATPDVHVHPRDRHPGPSLTSAYAADLVSAVLEATPLDRLAQAESSALSAPPRPSSLVSWVLPTAAEVHANPTQARIKVRASDLVALSGEPASQLVPCAALDRPHVRMVLSRLVPEGTVVAVAADDVPEGGLDVYTFGYDGAGRSLVDPLGLLEGGNEVVFTTGPRVRGVIAAPRSSLGCPTDKSIVLPDLGLWLTRR